MSKKLCDECGKNPATVRLYRSINGVSEEKHLCAECARSLHENPMELTINDLMASFFNQPMRVSPAKKCETCGMDAATFQRTGMLGCAACYDVFERELKGVLMRVQGQSEHTGRRPEGAPQSNRSKLNKLREELKSCLDTEDYEQAARLRDEIYALEAAEKGGDSE